ncbi:hypothetical protein ACP4OV_013722 [Aristida adscensionis]
MADVVLVSLLSTVTRKFWEILLDEDMTEIRSGGGHQVIKAKYHLEELEKYINDASFIVAGGHSDSTVLRSWIKRAQRYASCLEDQIAMHAVDGSSDLQLLAMKSAIGKFTIKYLTLRTRELLNKKNRPPELRGPGIMEQEEPSKISPWPADTELGMTAETSKVKEFLKGNCQVLFITGHQGSGKTTLIDKVCRDTNLTEQFTISRVNVPKTRSLVGLLRQLLRPTVDSDGIDDFNAIDEFQVTKMIHATFKKVLDKEGSSAAVKKKPYLIVLDNVQDTGVLYSLMHVLEGLEGKIICLTRKQDITKDIDVPTSAMHEPVHMQGLDDQDAEKLFMHAALPDSHDSTETDGFHTTISSRAETVKVILQKCNRNPLHIRTIGALLRTKPPEEWEEIMEQIDQSLNSIDPPIQPEQAKLTGKMRLAFLYCLAFPHESEIPENLGIPMRKLIRLWMAEGFLQDSPLQRQEQEAADLLQELIDKELLVVKKRGLDGEVLTCIVNKNIRQLASSMSELQKFCQIVPAGGDDASRDTWMRGSPHNLSMRDVDEASPTIRRPQSSHEGALHTIFPQLPLLRWRKGDPSTRYRMVAVHGAGGAAGITEAFKILKKDIRLRSMLYFKTGLNKPQKLELSFKSTYRLLRTLELQGTHLDRLPPSIVCLVCLRYLGLRGTQLEHLPAYLQRLKHLMCLDIRDTNITRLEDVSAFKEMRHLLLASSFRDRSVLIKEGLEFLIYLQTLSGAQYRQPSERIHSEHESSEDLEQELSERQQFEQELSYLRLLRKLSIKRASKASSKGISDAINKMEFLQSLTITCEEVKRQGEHFDTNSLETRKSLRKLKLGGYMGKPYDCLLKMQSITYLYLWDSKLSDDILLELQGLQHLLLLSLCNVGTSHILSCRNGYRSLKRLSIISIENLTVCKLGGEAMKRLQELEFAKCGKISTPPEGIEQIPNLRVVYWAEMPEGFSDGLTTRLKEKTGPNAVQVLEKKMPFHRPSRGRSATQGGQTTAADPVTKSSAEGSKNMGNDAIASTDTEGTQTTGVQSVTARRRELGAQDTTQDTSDAEAPMPQSEEIKVHENDNSEDDICSKSSQHEIANTERLPFKMGEPLVTPAILETLTHNMLELHEWYMKRSNQEVLPKIITVRYKEEHLHREGGGTFSVEFNHLHDLYNQDALDVSLLQCWILYETQKLRKNTGRVGFLDPATINQKVIQLTPKEVEEYAFRAFVKLKGKDFILLPYNFNQH